MIRAVLFDFYGTLARATHWEGAAETLSEHGYEFPDHIRDRWFNGGLDGIEHDEHSQSREHYAAWQRERTLAMLAECDVHPGEYAVILEKIRAGLTRRMMEAYDEVPDVLRELRTRGLTIAICSNWDWDLREAVAECGLADLVDVQVSSAWVGARKPHPRIYEHTLDEVEVDARDALFVGDTWGPDVAGPEAVGLAPVYLRRNGHWPDPGAPAHITNPTVVDLRGVLSLA